MTECDVCGKSLNRTCVRTDGSAVMAKSVGLFSNKVDGEWEFYCSEECQCG